MKQFRVYSPVPSGSGASRVHLELQRLMQGYRVDAYSPMFELAPFLLSLNDGDGADLIHTSSEHAIFHAKKNIPLVVTFHGYMLDREVAESYGFAKQLYYAGLIKPFTKIGVGMASAVTAVSEYTANLVRNDLDSNVDVRVIGNGVNTELFHPGVSDNSRSKINVLFSGNLKATKGSSLLPIIASLLPDDVELVCTSGLRKHEVSQPRKNMRVIGRVEHHRMPDLYRSVDILVHPTIREGMSLAILEAMASGLPIVASNCSSIPELVIDGKGGILCDKNDPEAFSHAIRTLAEDGELRRSYGDFNRRRVEELYTVERMCHGYLSLFEEILLKGNLR